MNSDQIKALLTDCAAVRVDANSAMEKTSPLTEKAAYKEYADAQNRTAIALSLIAEGVLGIQLEGAQTREAMAESYAGGKQLAPDELFGIVGGDQNGEGDQQPR